MTVRVINVGSATSPVIVRIKWEEQLKREQTPGSSTSRQSTKKRASISKNVLKRKRKKIGQSDTTTGTLSGLDSCGDGQKDEFQGQKKANRNRVVTPPLRAKEPTYNVVEEDESLFEGGHGDDASHHEVLSQADDSQQNNHVDENVSDLLPAATSTLAPPVKDMPVTDAHAPHFLITMTSCSTIGENEEETGKNQNHLEDEAESSELSDSELERAALVLHQLHQGRGLPTLAMPDDKDYLNSLHCFVRTHLLEFTSCVDGNTNKLQQRGIRKATKKQKGSCALNNTDGIKDDQQRVGLQCVYCAAHECSKQEQAEDGNIGTKTNRLAEEGSSSAHRASASAFFPKAVDEVYRGVCTWQRTHFPHCPHVPNHIKETYQRLKEKDKSRGKTKYWTDAAHRLGLRDIGMAKKEEKVSDVPTATDSGPNQQSVTSGLSAAAPSRLGICFAHFLPS